MPRRLMPIGCVIALILGAALAQSTGAWTVAGSGEGIYTANADGGLLLVCPIGEGPPEIDVGPYGLRPDTPYALTFEVDGREPLELVASVGPSTAVALAGDGATALIALMEGAATIRVRMALAAIRVPGGGLAFELPIDGFEVALAVLPCGAGAEGSAG